MSGLGASAQADAPFVPLNSSAAFKSSDKMYVHASRVSTSVRAVFSHPISLSLANQALHSPSPFCLIVHPFRIHPYCIYLVRLFRVHFHRACVVGLFRTRFLRAPSHANFRNARPIGLSQRLPSKQAFPRQFPQHLPQIPPRQARTGRRGPNHVLILQKMAEICGCERS